MLCLVANGWLAYEHNVSSNTKNDVRTYRAFKPGVIGTSKKLSLRFHQSPQEDSRSDIVALSRLISKTNTLSVPRVCLLMHLLQLLLWVNGCSFYA